MRLAIPHVLVPLLTASLATLVACSSKNDAPFEPAALDDGGTQGDTALQDAAPAIDPKYLQIAADFESSMKAKSVPGGGIALVVDGKLAFAKGIGLRKKDTDLAVSERTRFRMASVSKMVTASLVMKLVDEGAIDTTKTAVSYAPEFAFEPKELNDAITVEQVLTHTAGIGDGFTAVCDHGDAGLTKWFTAAAGTKLWVEPGKVWDYSNVGYSLAGLIAEKAGKAPYASLLATKIFAPLGMTATFDTATVAADEYAFAHTAAGKVQDPTKQDCGATRPYGYLFASIVDMAHFAEMLVNEGAGVLSPEAVQTMTAPHVEEHLEPGVSYGYGLMVREYKGQHVVEHGGDLPGFHTEVWTVPAKKLAVVVFVNADGFSPMNVAAHATDVLLGLDPAGVGYPPIPKDSFPKYQAHFVDPIYLGAFDVVLKDGNLVMSSSGTDTALTPWTGDTFVFDVGGGQQLPATFYFGADGKPSYFVTRAGVGVASTPMMEVIARPFSVRPPRDFSWITAR